MDRRGFRILDFRLGSFRFRHDGRGFGFGLFDEFQQGFLRPLPVKAPVNRPGLENMPAERMQDGITEMVAVAGGLLCGIGRSVAFDA